MVTPTLELAQEKPSNTLALMVVEKPILNPNFFFLLDAKNRTHFYIVGPAPSTGKPRLAPVIDEAQTVPSAASMARTS
jgi:hypothetical protein